jgi:hypothetical protein
MHGLGLSYAVFVSMKLRLTERVVCATFIAKRRANYMKTSTLTMSVAALVLAAGMAFGQEGAINSRTELRAALATARTAADHARIAYYYHRAATTYAQMQAEEEQIAAKWQAQFGSWTKSPNPYHSAKNLAAYYGKLASDALVHATEQDKLSGV